MQKKTKRGSVLSENNKDFSIESIGECRIPSPVSLSQFADDQDGVSYFSKIGELRNYLDEGKQPPFFEPAGPRRKIYFDPSKLKCGIVTCGGLCPGVNDVIRAIVLCLYHHYDVESVFGFRYGFEGLSPRYRHKVLELSPREVSDIHNRGGTILGSSRGPQDVSEIVDTLERMNVGILFAIGGDGTLRGAQAIVSEIEKRGLKIAVIGIPKTIDNDISHIEMSFGFDTAVTETRSSIYSAHVEALGARNGIGLVKLMGRHSGFIAAHAALANSDVNFCLVPEVPFTLEGFLKALENRLLTRNHAVVVVAEGAGMDLMEKSNNRDASGNIRLSDIGILLKTKINEYFREKSVDVTLKYIDPSYIIRSMPSNARDSAFCMLLGYNAVHAGMAGRTNMVVGNWRNEYTHVPIKLAVSRRKQLKPHDSIWNGVLAVTGQPREML